MHVSLQSKFYLGACVAIGAYNAYSNPVHWITSFAVGILAGTIMGRSDLLTARDGYQPGNSYGMGWNKAKDKEARQNAVISLADSMPDLATTAINLMALGLISQKIQLPSRVGSAIFCIAACYFGLDIGKLFQLEILRGSRDPYIQELLT